MGASAQLVRLHLAAAILAFTILPPVGLTWEICSFPGLMETPTQYPEDIPLEALTIGYVIMWICSPGLWWGASKLWNLRGLTADNSDGKGLIVLVGTIHGVVGFATLIVVGSVLAEKFSAQTPEWQVAVLSFCAFPISIASLFWLCTGYPISLYNVATDYRRREREAKIVRLLKEAGKKRDELARRREGSLSQRSTLQMEIDSLMATDPGNLGLKGKELASEAHVKSETELHELVQEVNVELEKVRKSRQQALADVRALEQQRSALRRRRDVAETRLRELQATDPSNVGVQIRVLTREWEPLSQLELEARPVSSEVGQLLKEVIVHRHQIRAKDQEITLARRRADDKTPEALLLLRKYILELEQIDRDLRIVDAELQRLRTKYGTAISGMVQTRS